MRHLRQMRDGALVESERRNMWIQTLQRELKVNKVRPTACPCAVL